MTEKELSRYYNLKREIKDLGERIEELGYGIGAIEISDMPKGASGSGSIVEKIAELRTKYVELRVSAIEEYLKIENFIGSVEESEIRTIMRMRYLDLKSWERIGVELYCDRTTVSKKVRRYLKELSRNSR